MLTDYRSRGNSTPAAEPLSRDAIRAVQSRLRQLGFYSGRIDGIWGPNMQASLQRFQQGRGLQATGQLNPTTVTALGLDRTILPLRRQLSPRSGDGKSRARVPFCSCCGRTANRAELDL